MALTQRLATKRSTSMPDSGTKEVERLTQAWTASWLISSATVSANATQASNLAYQIMLNGSYQLIAASNGTACWATGIGTVATSTTGAYIMTIASQGTHVCYVCGGASLGAIALPTVSAGDTPIAMIVIACTATAFNGGTNSLADSSYTVSAVSFVGQTGMMLTTENFTTVPG